MKTALALSTIVLLSACAEDATLHSTQLTVGASVGQRTVIETEGMGFRTKFKDTEKLDPRVSASLRWTWR